VQCAASAKTVQ